MNTDNSNNENKQSGKYVPPSMRNRISHNSHENQSKYRNQNRQYNKYHNKQGYNQQHNQQYNQQYNQQHHNQQQQPENLPGYKLQETEKPIVPIVPIDMESHKAGCEKANPYKMNFMDAIRKNKKEFTAPKITTSNRTHHYDYICAKCSKMVKREGLNVNNTNYCWECHSDIVFKNLPIVINDEDDDEYMGVPLNKRYEIRYENYLAGKYDHYFDGYN